MKQIGLGLHNYHDTNKSFPPGGVSFGSCCAVPTYTGWAISILPFVEAPALEALYNYSVSNQDAANKVVRETFVPVYICPSDLRTNLLDQPESGPGSGLMYAAGSYRSVMGISDASCWGDNDQYFDGGGFCARGRGVLHHVGIHPTTPSRLATTENMGAIIDGTSTTLMVGEYHTKSYFRRRTFWAYSSASYAQGAITIGQSRILIPDYTACVQIGGTGAENPCKRSLSSLHPGVTQFCLADASVRSISLTVHIKILENMATIAGAEAVQVPN